MKMMRSYFKNIIQLSFVGCFLISLVSCEPKPANNEQENPKDDLPVEHPVKEEKAQEIIETKDQTEEVTQKEDDLEEDISSDPSYKDPSYKDRSPVPGRPPGRGKGLINGDFEDGRDRFADGWSPGGPQPPRRSDQEAHSGKHSIHVKLLNEGPQHQEGLLKQMTFDSVVPGKTYSFSFWAKQVDHGVSYVQEYEVKWIDVRDQALAGGTGLTGYKGGEGKWAEIKVPEIVAPPNANGFEITFRCVTGAVDKGSGEVYIDNVSISEVKKD